MGDSSRNGTELPPGKLKFQIKNSMIFKGFAMRVMVLYPYKNSIVPLRSNKRENKALSCDQTVSQMQIENAKIQSR